MTAVHAEPRARRPVTGAVLLSARLVRRGGLAVVLGLAAWAVMEVRVFEASYPDLASRQQLLLLGDDPAVRILQGVAAGTSTGALVVWDAGWMLQMIVGVWAVVTASRLVRGDEDAGRSELLLAGRVRDRVLLAVQLGVLVTVCALAGLALALALAGAGADLSGALLFGAQVAGLGAAAVAGTALLAQVLGARGRVVGVAAGGLGAAVLLRMVANSADDRAWLGWITPLGWNDRLEPFGGNNALVLAVPLGVVLGLGGAALALRGRRDSGGSLLTSSRVPRSRRWGLSSPLAFAWRAWSGTFTGWAVGLAALGMVVGALLPSMVEFIEGDPSYAAILEAFGIDLEHVTLGFISMMSVITGLVIALAVTWRIGAARAEEDAGRLEHLLVRPVERWRWLGGHVLLAGVTAVLLAAIGALATWGAARAAGAELALGDAAAAGFGALPAVAVFGGLAVALLGLAPRLVVPVGAAVTMAAYVVELVGPALHWPEAVLSLSPFHHLEQVPVDPFGLTAALVMGAVAVALVVLGMVAFQRRDLVGG